MVVKRKVMGSYLLFRKIIFFSGKLQDIFKMRKIRQEGKYSTQEMRKSELDQ